MRLTKTHREAFVRAVMQDVPRIDYKELARKLVLDDSIKQLPPKMRAIAADKEANHFLRTENFYVYHTFQESFTVYCGRGNNFKLSEKGQKDFDELAAKYKAQSRDRDNLKEKIGATIAECSTLKVAKARLPEFEKYLPQDTDAFKTPNVPAIANLVADLTKLGWPKDKTPATK